MMHPLAHFDLDEDADERAVKRAYARRLKVTRPDEDAAAFQALNEAYQEALAYIRWRDAQEEAEEAEGEEGKVSGQAPAPVPPSDPLDLPSEPAQPTDVTRDPAGMDIAETPQEYVFSVVGFVARMRSGGHYVNPDRFRTWIQERMGDWPITAKPAFARAIICHVFENRLHFHPDVYDVLIEELGLDDIRSSAVDPLEIAHYRDELVRRYEAEIVAPAFAPVVERGRLWRWFDAIRDRVGIPTIVIGCAGLLLVYILFLPVFTYKPPLPNPPSHQSPVGNKPAPTGTSPIYGVDRTTAELWNAADGQSGTQRIDTLDKVISRLSDRTESASQRLLAYALYDKAYFLREDSARSYAVYADLQRRFFRKRDNHDIAVLVAASYVNVGREEYKLHRFDTAMAAFDTVLDHYGDIVDGRIGIQVDKAMFGQIEVLNAQGRKEEALRKLDEADAKFADATDPVLKATKAQNAKYRAKIASGEK